MGQLKDRVALVTGAGSGIGRGVALRLARDGAAVGVLDCDSGSCSRVVDEIKCAGGRAVALHCDVSDSAAMTRAVNQLADNPGPPAIAVHSAAIMPTGTILETTDAQWDRVHEVNVRGAYLMCREVLPHMLRARHGSIVFISSITGVNGLPGLAAYSSTKGALISLARALAVDYARDSIRVNAVAPGTIDSPMLHAFVNAQADPEGTRKAFDEVQPRGRVGTIDEVASLVAFLVSEESSLISGVTVPVDGGMSIKSEQPRR